MIDVAGSMLAAISLNASLGPSKRPSAWDAGMMFACAVRFSLFAFAVGGWMHRCIEDRKLSNENAKELIRRRSR